MAARSHGSPSAPRAACWTLTTRCWWPWARSSPSRSRWASTASSTCGRGRVRAPHRAARAAGIAAAAAAPAAPASHRTPCPLLSLSPSLCGACSARDRRRQHGGAAVRAPDRPAVPRARGPACRRSQGRHSDGIAAALRRCVAAAPPMRPVLCTALCLCCPSLVPLLHVVSALGCGCVCGDGAMVRLSRPATSAVPLLFCATLLHK